jgi:hypothetical protein
MARDYINISRGVLSATQSSKLLDLRNVMREAYNKAKEILAIMTHNNDGVNWTDIETLFGLPAGKGQTVFNMVNGSVGAMEGTMTNSQCKDMTELLG